MSDITNKTMKGKAVHSHSLVQVNQLDIQSDRSHYEIICADENCDEPVTQIDIEGWEKSLSQYPSMYDTYAESDPAHL